MYNLTKLKLLWEKVTGIEKKISDNTAYTPPAYSSTGEVNTGQKWIDGKDIYCKSFTGAFTGDSVGIATGITGISDVIDIKSVITNTNESEITISYCCGFYVATATRNNITLNITSGALTVQSATTFTNGKYIVTVYYTKASATRSDDPEPIDKGTGMITGEEPEQETKTVKRKTTKKEEK